MAAGRKMPQYVIAEWEEPQALIPRNGPATASAELAPSSTRSHPLPQVVG
jgi:hypothetical protein